MATPNVGILTTAGKALIDKVNSGQAKISFSKVVFSSMDNSQLSDTQAKALTAIVPQEVVVSSPETTLDTNSGETRIRATGTNKQLADGVYVKTYGVFAKDDTGHEVLYSVTVSPNPNYFPAYDGVTPQAVTYSYKTVIQETSNITMTNSNDVYVTQEDLTEAIGKIPQPDLSNYVTQQQLAIKADDSKVVHTADMRKPANQVAGMDDVNAKQDKLTYTAANDATSFHRDATGTVNESGNFPGLQVEGVDVATAADLKSIEASAWRPIISDNYSGLCMMKYNADIGTMSLSGTIFPKMWSPEGSRFAIIIPLPSGFAMGENSNAKISLMIRIINYNVQQFEYALVDLFFETDGIHIVFDKVYAHTQTFIVLDGFFNSDTKETQSSSFIDFKVTKN